MNQKKVDEGIKALESLDPHDEAAFEKAIAAFRHVGQLPFLIFDHPDLPIDVFHARTHEIDNYFETFSDIGLPPAAVVKQFARCNIPGNPVFYCADFRPTSYLELLEYWVEEKNEEFLHVTIGKWTITNDLKALIVTSPFEEDWVTNYDKVHGDKLQHFISQHDGEMKPAMTRMYKFLFDRFRKPAKKDLLTYIITSCYCHLAFGQTKNPIDAILYPSVPFGGKGINIAIKSGYPFNENMKLILVARDSFRRIDSRPLPTFQQSAFKQAIELDYKKEKIIW